MRAGNREWGTRKGKTPSSCDCRLFSDNAQRGRQQIAAGRSCSAHSLFPIPYSRQRASRARATGFTLIEVIAAIVLLAIAFTALMQVLGGSIRLTQNAAGYTEASMWARSKLDSAFVGEPLEPGQTSGRFNDTYRWQLAVTPWQVAGPPPQNSPLQLYQLDLDVAWGPLAHPRSAHFRTLRAASPVKGPFGQRGGP